MRTNTYGQLSKKTEEGGPAEDIKPYDQLRRMVLASMLWEDSFYINGRSSAEMVHDLCKIVDHDGRKILHLAWEAHTKYLLRHMPLFLVVQALKKPNNYAAPFIQEICSRPDQMTELLSLYWKDGKCALSKQLRKGLAMAFRNFDSYQLAKYNRDNPIKLRDILFLCHPKPKDDKQATAWRDLANKTLAPPDTWEVRLSAGEDKKESFKELLENGKMGTLAILRNLSNMHDAGVPRELVHYQLFRKMRPMLPFQFIAAAKACPQWEPLVDEAMIAACKMKEKLPGKTIVFVDVSGSMNSPISSKSQMVRMDAACAFAILLSACCEEVEIYTFSAALCAVAPRQGMALRDAIVNSQSHVGTYLGQAMLRYMQVRPHSNNDRIIVITDEQIADQIPLFLNKRKYILNVGNNKNGLLHLGKWLVINGFSEASIDYIREVEEGEDKWEKRDEFWDEMIGKLAKPGNKPPNCC